MRCMYGLFFVALMAGVCWAAENSSVLDSAVNQACEKAAQDLAKTDLKDIRNIAVMPFWGQDQDGYVSDTFKSYLTRLSVPVVARTKPEWDQLLGEIKWESLREDSMNPETVQRFGKIEGCDAIVYGNVRQRMVDKGKMSAQVNMTLHMADVETGKLIWSSGPVEDSVKVSWDQRMPMLIRHPILRWTGGIVALVVVGFILMRFVARMARPR
jgi:hypothetical protein